MAAYNYEGNALGNVGFAFMDLDWDVSNNMPIDEDGAKAVMKAGRDIYADTEYFPYKLYK